MPNSINPKQVALLITDATAIANITNSANRTADVYTGAYTNLKKNQYYVTVSYYYVYNGSQVYRTTVAGGTIPTALGTIIPKPVYWFNTVATTDNYNNNTVGHTAMFELTGSIVINKITIYCTAVNTPGTVKVGIYSEDGQTKLLDQNITITAGSGYKSLTLGSPVTLPAGNYYYVGIPVGSTSCTLRVFGAIAQDFGNISGSAVLTSEQTVVASTLPTNFNPTTLVYNIDNMAIMRLD